MTGEGRSGLGELRCSKCKEPREAADLDRLLWCEFCVAEARGQAKTAGWIIGGVAAGWMGSETAAPSVVLQPQSLAAATPEPTRFDEPTPVAEALPEPTPALPAEPVEAPPTPVEAATVAVAPPVPGCEAPSGELIGYWYAGEDAPGAAGEEVTIAQTVNVRADYPEGP